MGCDDGNVDDGDGCSKTCTVEDGWACSNTSPTSPSVCGLTTDLVLTYKSQRKAPGTNKLIVVITTSLPVRLTTANVTVALTNNALESYTITMISLTEYQFEITYKANIQSSQLSISVNINKGRLLLWAPRLLATSTFDFNFDINPYPPANYYPPSTTTTYNGINIFLHIVCALTLILSVVGFVGIKRVVYYSMELFNFLVIVYILEGMGLIGYSDWIAYSIPTMRQYSLLGGYGLGLCNCLASALQYDYGYGDQLFENAGIVLIFDFVILAVVAVIFGVYKIKKSDPKEKRRIGLTDKFWIFAKYYALAFLLVFNTNVAFSSFLTLFTASSSTSVAVANIIFASIILTFCVAFYVGLFFWTRELSVPIVYPEPKVKDKENEHVHDRSSAILSGNHSRPGSEYQEDSK